MSFDSLTGSGGDGWKSSGWELSPDILRAGGPSGGALFGRVSLLGPLGTVGS